MSGLGSTNTVFPVVLRVPPEKEALKGRDKVRFLSEYARAALKESAAQLGVDLPRLEKEENGAPVPAGGLFWSISHKSLYVAAVAAPKPAGIDLEQIRAVKAGLDERIAAPAEWALFSEDRQNDFFRCWTAKEAVLKAAGVGIAGLEDCRIVSVSSGDRLSAVFREQRWTVRFRFADGHVAAVAGNGLRLCWIGPEGDNPCSPS